MRTNKDVELGFAIQSVCQKYFGLNAHYLGHLDHDNAVWQSLRKKRPLLLEYPNSRLYTQILGITRDLVNPNSRKLVV